MLDTNVWILHDQLPHDALPSRVLISSIVLAELSAGPLAIGRGNSPGDEAELSHRIRTLSLAEALFTPVPFGAEAARAYGQLYAAVLAVGRQPRRRIADLMIAAVARAEGLPLFTTNPGDFAGLEELVTVVAVARPAAGKSAGTSRH